MLVYKGKKIEVRKEYRKLPNGKRPLMDIVKTPDAVVLLPFIDKGTILLERQYRPVLGKWIYELSAGTLERGEKPIFGARRELEEETGFNAKEIKKLYKSYAMPGTVTEIRYFFVARGLVKSVRNLDEDEVINMIRVKMKKALKMIEDGRIVDGKTIECILFYNLFSG